MVNFVNTALLNVFLFFSVLFAWMCQIMFIGDKEEIHHLYCFTIYTLSDLVNLALLSPLKFYINVLWNKKSWVLKNKIVCISLLCCYSKAFHLFLQIMIILKIQKLIIFFFFYKLVWLIHITYPLWSCNLFINMTFHIVNVT